VRLKSLQRSRVLKNPAQQQEQQGIELVVMV
jgi:hypothetical protein